MVLNLMTDSVRIYCQGALVLLISVTPKDNKLCYMQELTCFSQPVLNAFLKIRPTQL